MASCFLHGIISKYRNLRLSFQDGGKPWMKKKVEKVFDDEPEVFEESLNKEIVQQKNGVTKLEVFLKISFKMVYLGKVWLQ